MSRNIRQSPIAERFEHLLSVLSSRRFLQMEGLGNEVPFFICDYAPAESVEMAKMQRQLANRLNQQGTRVLEINLYSLSIQLLKAEGDFIVYMGDDDYFVKENLSGYIQFLNENPDKGYILKTWINLHENGWQGCV